MNSCEVELSDRPDQRLGWEVRLLGMRTTVTLDDDVRKAFEELQ